MTTLQSEIAVSESSPEVIASFVQQVILEYQSYGTNLRRTEQRESVAIPVTVTPLHNDLRPSGPPFHAVTRDVSCVGIGLFHASGIDSEWLEIRLNAPHSDNEMKLLAKVEHSTPCGRYFIIGCQFGQSPKR